MTTPTKKEQKKAAKKARTSKKAQPAANVAAVNELMATTQDAKPLGVKVWWDLWKVDGLRKDIEKAFKDFDAEPCIPADLTPAARMKYAMERMRSKCGVDWKVAGQDNDWVTFAAVKAKQIKDDSAQKDQHKATVDPKVVSNVAVHRKDGKVSVKNPRCEIARCVIDEYVRLETHFTAWELSTAIVAVVDSLNGARLRLAGGMYFVPANPEALVMWTAPGGVQMQVDKKLVALHDYVRTVGGCDFYIEQVMPASATARAAANTTTRTLNTEFDAIFAQANEFVTALSLGEAISTRSLNAKIKAAKALRGRAELFSEILADRGAQIMRYSEIVANVMADILDKSVEIRTLEKIKGSDTAAEAAKKLAAELSHNASQQLLGVRNRNGTYDAPANDDGDKAEAKAS